VAASQVPHELHGVIPREPSSSLLASYQVLTECMTPVTCKPSLMPSAAASRLLHGLHSIFTFWKLSSALPASYRC